MYCYHTSKKTLSPKITPLPTATPTKTMMSQKTSEKSDDCKACGLFCGGCTLVLGVAIALICWIVYSIIALVNNSNDDIRAVCNDSNLWACLLTMVILSLIQVGTGKSAASKEEGETPVAACCSLVISIGLFIWEAIELFNPCIQDHYGDSRSGVYLMLFIHFCFVAVILGLLIVGGIVFCIYLACCASKEEDDGSTWVNGNALPYEAPPANNGKPTTGDVATNV